MTTISWLFAALSVAFASVDWWATWAERVTVRYVAKPGALVALIGVALTVDPTVSGTVRTTMVIGLVLSLAGDVFLMLDDRWFIAGLGSFLVGHLAYIVGLQLAPTSASFMLVGLVVVAVAIALVGRRVVAAVAAGDQRDMVAPVIVYLLAISAMVVSAFGTKAAWAIVGAGLFYASDATLAWNRFIERRPWGPLTVMITYHLGQAGLVAWLVTG